MKSFATTEATVGGKIVKAGAKFKFGDYPFAGAIILGFSAVDDYGDQYALVARPYAQASCVGTTGPTALVGVETVELTTTSLAALIALRS